MSQVAVPQCLPSLEYFRSSCALYRESLAYLLSFFFCISFTYSEPTAISKPVWTKLAISSTSPPIPFVSIRISNSLEQNLLLCLLSPSHMHKLWTVIPFCTIYLCLPSFESSNFHCEALLIDLSWLIRFYCTTFKITHGHIQWYIIQTTSFSTLLSWWSSRWH